MGYRTRDRASSTDEGLEIIRRLWAGETLDFSGQHYRIKGAKLEPPPVQTPHPPLWGGGFAPAAAKRAARLADGYIGTGDMVAQAEIFRSEWDKAGRSGRGRLAGGHFWLMVSADPQRTFADVSPHVLYQIEMYNKWLGDAGQSLFPAISSTDTLKESDPQLCIGAASGRHDRGLRGGDRYRTLLQLDRTAWLRGRTHERTSGPVRRGGDAASSLISLKFKSRYLI